MNKIRSELFRIVPTQQNVKQGNWEQNTCSMSCSQTNYASSPKRMVTYEAYEALIGQSQSSRHTKILPVILCIQINVKVAEQKLAKKIGISFS